MRLTHETETVEMCGSQDTRNFSLNSEGVSVFNALAVSLYTRKLFAFIRETAQNGSDETDEPLEIHLPTVYEPWLGIRDYGPGLDEDAMFDLYTCVGMSTKTEDVTKTGGFGVGSKAAFAYSDTFTVVSFHGGKAKTYVCAFDQVNLPTISLMHTRDMEPDERTGLDVQCPIERNDYGQARNEVVEACSRFPVPPKLSQGTMPKMEYAIKYNSWGLRDATMREGQNLSTSWRVGPRAVVGRMHYPLDLAAIEAKSKDPYAKSLSEVWDSKTDLDLFLDIDAVDVVLNREGLAYTEHTVNSIVECFKRVDRDIAGMVDAKLSGIKTLWEFTLAYKEMIGADGARDQVRKLQKRGASVLREKYGKEYSLTNPAGGMFPGDQNGSIGLYSLLDNQGFRYAFKAKRMGCSVESLKKATTSTDAEGNKSHYIQFPYDIHEWYSGAFSWKYTGQREGTYHRRERERKQYSISPLPNYAIVVIPENTKTPRYFDRLNHHFSQQFPFVGTWGVCVISHKYVAADPHITLQDVLAFLNPPSSVPIIQWDDLLEPPAIVHTSSGTRTSVGQRAKKVQQLDLDFKWHSWGLSNAPFSRMTKVVEVGLDDGETNYYVTMNRGQPLIETKHDTKFKNPEVFINEMNTLFKDKVFPKLTEEGTPTPIYGISKSLVKEVEKRENWVNICDLARVHYKEQAEEAKLPLKHTQIWEDWLIWAQNNHNKHLGDLSVSVGQVSPMLNFLGEDEDFTMDNLFGKVLADYTKARSAYIRYNHLKKQCEYWGVTVNLKDIQPEICSEIKTPIMNRQWLEPYPMLHALMRRGMWTSCHKALEKECIKHYIQQVDKERKLK